MEPKLDSLRRAIKLVKLQPYYQGKQEEKYKFRELIEIGPKKLQGGQFLCLDKETIHL